jgi:phenylpropionate dioxygenase-like ring-hydroxylating dioxygenase large terminal subunit
MKRQTEIELVKELLTLKAGGSAFLDDSVERNPVESYVSDEQFMRERERIFKAQPQPLAHISELPQPHSYLRRSMAGLPVLLTRDADGAAHAFLNVCRHRGTRLVDEASGCKQRLVCPYHAWTWNTRGELIGVPHESQGFPGLVREDYALKPLVCTERNGWLWVSPSGARQNDVDDDLSGLLTDFDWFGASELSVVHTEEQTCAVNWKIIVEGGMEAYHFRVAHRQTIAPYFEDNLSTYQRFGPHLRSVLARNTLTELEQCAEEQWRLRDHAQLLYTIFPTNSFLVQSDHVVWIRLEPLSASSTWVSLNTLAPKNRTATKEDRAYWAKNHAITVKTLAEDFAIGESIQSGLESGANEHLTFGRFEGALAAFSDSVRSYL